MSICDSKLLFKIYKAISLLVSKPISGLYDTSLHSRIYSSMFELSSVTEESLYISAESDDTRIKINWNEIYKARHAKYFT